MARRGYGCRGGDGLAFEHASLGTKPLLLFGFDGPIVRHGHAVAKQHDDAGGHATTAGLHERPHAAATAVECDARGAAAKCTAQCGLAATKHAASQWAKMSLYAATNADASCGARGICVFLSSEPFKFETTASSREFLEAGEEVLSTSATTRSGLSRPHSRNTRLSRRIERRRR